MAESFEEGSTFYKEHQETWANFCHWAVRGTVLAIVLVIIAFYFIVS